ncbi:ABC transporter substrate-binding protein [Roseomonas gilardii]|uniref:ABC transporter substrate-binding protein n=1 Tax=Roseomonas gilardii TaxID=257708 RepID=UPI0011A48282|nr:ABC transporter substrate-binding protein [Roseomonas gilardii]
MADQGGTSGGAAPPWRRRRLLQGMGALSVTMLAGGRPARAAGDMLRFALSTFPPNWRPYTHTGAAGGAVKLMLHRRLVRYDSQGTPQAELAESWTREADGSYLFRLREGLRFQNGDPVDAEAVKYSLEQIANPRSSAFLRVPLSIITGIDVVDARTVRIRLREHSVTLPLYLASYNCPIISPKSTDAEAIGCGPYRLADQERGTRLDFTAFDGYYRPGLPRTPKLRFLNYADESLRVAALQAGDVDMIEYVPWQSMDGIEANARLQLDGVPDGAFMCLTFNCKQGPFTDPRLRRAVGHAVNRADVVQAAFFGRATPLEGLPSPASSPFTDPAALKVFPHDVARARQLMAEAGMAGGFSTTILATSTYNMVKNTAEVAQRNLAEIGIQATLQMPDYPTRINQGNRGQFEMSIMGYGMDFNDPDALTTFLASNPQGSYVRSWGYVNERLDGLLQRARAEFDDEARKALYREITPIAAQDAPVVGLAWRSQAFAMKKEVTGFRNLPGALTFSAIVSLEEVSIA